MLLTCGVPGAKRKNHADRAHETLFFLRKTPEALRRAGDLTSAEAAFSVACDLDEDEDRLGEKPT